jgi:hypothetical protein
VSDANSVPGADRKSESVADANAGTNDADAVANAQADDANPITNTRLPVDVYPIQQPDNHAGELNLLWRPRPYLLP